MIEAELKLRAPTEPPPQCQVTVHSVRLFGPEGAGRLYLWDPLAEAFLGT